MVPYREKVLERFEALVSGVELPRSRPPWEAAWASLKFNGPTKLGIR